VKGSVAPDGSELPEACATGVDADASVGLVDADTLPAGVEPVASAVAGGVVLVDGLDRPGMLPRAPVSAEAPGMLPSAPVRAEAPGTLPSAPVTVDTTPVGSGSPPLEPPEPVAAPTAPVTAEAPGTLPSAPVTVETMPVGSGTLPLDTGTDPSAPVTVETIPVGSGRLLPDPATDPSAPVTVEQSTGRLTGSADVTVEHGSDCAHATLAVTGPATSATVAPADTRTPLTAFDEIFMDISCTP